MIKATSAGIFSSPTVTSLRSLKALLAAAPLERIELERQHDLGRSDDVWPMECDRENQTP